MSKLKRLLPLFAIGALAGCDGTHVSFFDPQGPVAAAQRTHFLLILALVMLAVLPVLILTPLLIWRYRYGGRATYRPRWSFRWSFEFLLWGLPLTIVTVLAVLLWDNTMELDPWRPIKGEKSPLRIQVVGYDWKWLFIYPDLGIATVGKIIFPAGTPLAFELTSQTVMQSFWIPALGSQVYAMGGGMVTQLHLLAYAPGVFRGLNTQYNGRQFDEERFEAQAMPAYAFNEWVASVRTEGVPLDARARSLLAEPNTAKGLARLFPGNGEEVVSFYPIPTNFFADLVAHPSASNRGH